MIQLTMTIFIILLASGVLATDDKPSLKDEKERINYSVGYQIGGDFKKQGVELKPEAIVQGIRDALEETKPLISPEEMRTTLVNLKKKISADQELQRKKLAEQFRGEGRVFMAENAKKEGVVTLPSALQYRVLREGTGKSPSMKDTITVHYQGTLIDGTEFNSSQRDGKPLTITLGTVIPGWKEALTLMKEGARWQLFIPSDLAFGERGPLADRTIIYEIELVAVIPGQ